jgi:hypothetical protein
LLREREGEGEGWVGVSALKVEDSCGRCNRPGRRLLEPAAAPQIIADQWTKRQTYRAISRMRSHWRVSDVIEIVCCITYLRCARDRSEIAVRSERDREEIAARSCGGQGGGGRGVHVAHAQQPQQPELRHARHRVQGQSAEHVGDQPRARVPEEGEASSECDSPVGRWRAVAGAVGWWWWGW